MSTPFTHRHRVRYVECDMQGIVFNAHYYTWIDIAHTEWMRHVFGSFEELVGLGVDVVVAESSCRFRSPARFDDQVDIAVGLEDLTTSSMTTTHTFTRAGELLAEGRIRHVAVHPESLTKVPWPAAVRAALSAPTNGS
jgi:acyl-CoA thioester hydrolase